MNIDHTCNLPAYFYLNDQGKLNAQKLIKLSIAKLLGKIISTVDIPVCLITFSDILFWLSDILPLKIL
jgi:hypothetical protein